MTKPLERTTCQLSPRLLKAVDDEIAYPVATIFRKSLDSGVASRDWKTANVTLTPLFKKGSRHQMSNYRPVSLTSQIGKVAESVLCGELVQHLQRNDYWQDAAKRQTTGIEFNHRTKIWFFAPHARCTDSRQTWQGRRARGSARLCKISPQSPQGGGKCGLKNIKNFHFFVKSRPAGATHLTEF